MAVAFWVVAEYVPGRLRAALAVACGLADGAAAPACSPTAAASIDIGERLGDGGELGTRRQAAATGEGWAAEGHAPLLAMLAEGKPRTEGGAP
ncbi:hypothetical_protein [Leishmania major strain Friedlin]|nr:hypothetical_protein [Leishmania major strain Friedlin]